MHDVSFLVPPGQIVGIVGPSGSGKSTLAKLIQRLYVPEAGRVLVDGVDLATVDAAWLRRQLGVVLQEDMLFNRSVRDNIALVDPTMPMEQIIAAASLAGAHEFVLQLPEGYDTLVGERGSSLSGGQRQRIAIARALVTDPRILIFDEATSALDYESERIIQDNMQKICERRTVFVIAHRLSTIRRADQIITIERGRLVEDGTHDELMHSKGPTPTCITCKRGSNDDGQEGRRFPDRQRRRRDHETAFLPATLEVIETPPSPIGRTIGATIIAVFCVAVIWASLGKVDMVATAPGKIVPSGRTKTVQPFEAGVVRAIRVRDGASVKAGDVMIELDPTISAAEVEHARSDLAGAELDVARLRAAIAGPTHWPRTHAASRRK